MRKNLLSKALVLGVIFLFIGVGFQPAFAVESNLSADNIEKVEDCDCQEADSQNLIRIYFLLTRLEVVANILLLRFGHIPEVKEWCQDLLEVINSFKQSDESPICDMLYILFTFFDDRAIYWASRGFETANLLYIAIGFFLLGIASIFHEMARYHYDCEWADK